MGFCKSPQVSRDATFDYYRLVDDPAAVMTQCMPRSASIRRKEYCMPRWLTGVAATPRGARLQPLQPRAIRLHPDEVAEQYSDYMRHFDIPREQEGLGGQRLRRSRVGIW